MTTNVKQTNIANRALTAFSAATAFIVGNGALAAATGIAFHKLWVGPVAKEIAWSNADMASTSAGLGVLASLMMSAIALDAGARLKETMIGAAVLCGFVGAATGSVIGAAANLEAANMAAEAQIASKTSVIDPIAECAKRGTRYIQLGKDGPHYHCR